MLMITLFYEMSYQIIEYEHKARESQLKGRDSQESQSIRPEFNGFLSREILSIESRIFSFAFTIIRL